MTVLDKTLIDTIATSPLATHLTKDQVAVLADVVRIESFPARVVLAPEGSSDNHLYVVVEGTLNVARQPGTPGEEVLVSLGAGDFAHELGFLDGAVRHAALVAASDVRVLVLERQGLESLLDSYPRVVYGVMCSIIRVVHRIQARLSMQTGELTNYIVKQHGRY